jgi:hypothetical protein
VVSEKGPFTGDEVYNNLVSKSPDITSYSAGRMNIRIIDNDEELNLRGAVRMIKDSAIMVSVNAFAGIEAARMLFTRDSVKILDRINNRYFLGNYIDSKRFLPVAMDYDIIQSVFLGSSVRIIEEFDILERNGGRYLFNKDIMTVDYTGSIFPGVEDGSGSDILRISLDNNFLMKDIELFSRVNDIYSRVRFNSFHHSGGFYFPDDIDFHYVSHNLPLFANLKISRIEVDRDFNFTFSVPSRYKPF